MGKKIDLVGQRFTRLFVREDVGRDKHGRVLYLCECDCGNETVVQSGNLRSGHTTSCGCYSRERLITHGMTKTRLYRIWRGILSRAGVWKGADERHKIEYRDRGITVCDEWLIFESFRDWALSHGYADDLQIDRIDNDKGYSPENCRWVSRKENMNNRRNTLRLEDGTPLAMFCSEVGIPMRENGRPSKQYVRIEVVYRKGKAHPELIQAANNTIALYRKTLELLKLLEDVKRFAAEVSNLTALSPSISNA